MMEIKIKSGTSKSDAFKEAIRLAKLLSIDITFKFNGDHNVVTHYSEIKNYI